jgi:hypothetical protein
MHPVTICYYYHMVSQGHQEKKLLPLLAAATSASFAVIQFDLHLRTTISSYSTTFSPQVGSLWM